MINSDLELVTQLGIIVPEEDERPLDTIAKEIERVTGQITRVNDTTRRLIVVGVGESKVAETRNQIAKLGFMTGVQSGRRP